MYEAALLLPRYSDVSLHLYGAFASKQEENLREKLACQRLRAAVCSMKAIREVLGALKVVALQSRSLTKAEAEVTAGKAE